LMKVMTRMSMRTRQSIHIRLTVKIQIMIMSIAIEILVISSRIEAQRGKDKLIMASLEELLIDNPQKLLQTSKRS